ncbi:MAG: hypothetical protein VYB73_02345 [Verrucomicrobiota bacterium]|nr:hypothetical protein [Verrucomicrobiota bacterium]
MMAKLIANFCFFLALPIVQVKSDQQSQEDSLSGSMPNEALLFFETIGFSKFLKEVKQSEVLQSLISSGDLEDIKSSHFFKEAESVCRVLELVLRTDIWELNDRFLSGRMAIAAYPPDEDSSDPEVIILIRPSEPSNWLKNRIRFAPLLRLGIKRIGRGDFQKGVFAYRTRGKIDNATLFALHDEWILAASNKKLLKHAVALQGSKVVGLDNPLPLSKDSKYLKMKKASGNKHLASVYLNTEGISEIDGRFGIPEQIDDPMLALILGDAIKTIGRSSYAGITLDYGEDELLLNVCMDMDSSDLKESTKNDLLAKKEHRILEPPKVTGYLGGISIYQPFTDSPKDRKDVFKSTIIPGSELTKGKLGDFLFGESKDQNEGFFGDSIVFLSAQANDAGVDEQGVKLPGFCFIVDLKKIDGAEEAIKNFSELMLSEISPKEGIDWIAENELYKGLDILVSRIKDTKEVNALTPASVRLGNLYVVSSSRDLCVSVIDCLSVEGKRKIVKKELLFNVDFSELLNFFSTNRTAYEKEFVREGRSEKQAKEDYENLRKILNGFDSITGSSEEIDGNFKFQFEGKLKSLRKEKD